MKKWQVKLLLGLGIILLMLTAWFLSSSIRSKNAVERYKAQLRAAGEKLSVDDLIPPHPNPEKNGVLFFDDACRYMNSSAGVLQSNAPPVMRMIAPGKAMVGWQQNEIVSVYDSNPVTNTWDDIEKALSDQGPAFSLLQQAAGRPELNFDWNYRAYPNLSFAHLMKLKGAALILSPAVSYNLHLGDTAASVNNLHTLLALEDAWQDEPTLISQLVRIAMTGIAFGAQWEVLQATNVTDSELSMLQRDWEMMEFVRPMEKSLIMERDWGYIMIERLRGSNSPSAASVMFPSSGTGGGGSSSLSDEFKMMGGAARRKTADTLWRVSWSYSDELLVLKAEQAMIKAVRQISTNGFFRDAQLELDHTISAIGVNRASESWLRNTVDHEIWSSLVEPIGSLDKTINRMLAAEVTREMVLTAIAVKRYQLRLGSLPKDLPALVPEFLSEIPRDPVDGKSLRYRTNWEGTFLLYSVGEDGNDNGGDATPPGPTKTFYWLRGRDWVWPQPATAQEVQFYYDHPPK
jgi:hypothetical protein